MPTSPGGHKRWAAGAPLPGSAGMGTSSGARDGEPWRVCRCVQVGDTGVAVAAASRTLVALVAALGEALLAEHAGVIRLARAAHPRDVARLEDVAAGGATRGPGLPARACPQSPVSIQYEAHLQ